MVYLNISDVAKINQITNVFIKFSVEINQNSYCFHIDNFLLKEILRYAKLFSSIKFSE